MLALLVLGGVVAAVLLEVALVAGGADPLDDLRRARDPQVLELGLELVEGSWVSQIVRLLAPDCVIGAPGRWSVGGRRRTWCWVCVTSVLGRPDVRWPRRTKLRRAVLDGLRDSQNNEANNSTAIRAGQRGSSLARRRCSRSASTEVARARSALDAHGGPVAVPGVKVSSPTTVWSLGVGAHRAASAADVARRSRDVDPRGRRVLVDDVEPTQVATRPRGGLRPTSSRPARPSATSGHDDPRPRRAPRDATGAGARVPVGRGRCESARRHDGSHLDSRPCPA